LRAGAVMPDQPQDHAQDPARVAPVQRLERARVAGGRRAGERGVHVGRSRGIGRAGRVGQPVGHGGGEHNGGMPRGPGGFKAGAGTGSRSSGAASRKRSFAPGYRLPASGSPPLPHRDNRHPITPAATAAPALSEAKVPMVAPTPRSTFMPTAMATSPKRQTAVSTAFWPL